MATSLSDREGHMLRCEMVSAVVTCRSQRPEACMEIWCRNLGGPEFCHEDNNGEKVKNIIFIENSGSRTRP